MMEFNDMVTEVPMEDRELRELEVLVKLVPFVERDVEERCAALEEMKEENLRAIDNEVYANSDNRKGAKRMVEERYEKVIREENERLEKLRRGILERAGRLFPELAAEEPQEVFRPVSAGAEPSFNAADKERDAQCVFSGVGDGCPPDRAKS